MTRVAQVLVGGLFQDKRVHAILIETSPTNKSSCRVAEKCRFVHTASGFDLNEGRPFIRYELTREDYCKNPKSTL